MNRIAHAFCEWFAPFVPPQSHRLPLLWAFATGVVAYGIFIFHHLLHDHAPRMPWIDIGTFSSFGRWATIPIFALGYNADVPILNPIIGLLFLLFSGYYLFLIISEKDVPSWQVYLFVSLVIAFPINLSFFFYTFSTLISTASILFAVMAAFSCRKGTWLGGILGFIFLLLMWTTYQASIGVFLVVIGAFFIAAFLRSSAESNGVGASARTNLLAPFVGSFVALVASAGVYAISFKLLARGIRHASSISLEALPGVWLAAGQSAFRHLWATQPELHKTIKVLLLGMVCLAFLGSLWACRRSWSRLLLLLLLWPCCLLATKAIFFLVEAKFPFYEYRVNAALGFFYAFVFWVLFFLTRRTKWLNVLCVVLACFTLLRFVQADLLRQIVCKRGETHDLALANRLLSRIEALEGLDPSKKYQLVRIGNYPWFRRSLMTDMGSVKESRHILKKTDR